MNTNALRKMVIPRAFAFNTAALCALLLLPLYSHADDLVIEFTPLDIHRWAHKSFVDHSDYTLIDEKLIDQNAAVIVTETTVRQTSTNVRQVLAAKTHGKASALYLKTTIDLTKTPYLQWRWRVDKKMTVTDAQKKSQDDYPARIYVIVKEGIFPWQARSLNYVWASHSPKQAFWPNPYTDRAIMIPLRNSGDNLQQWYGERVNIAEDYQRVFGRSITEIHGIAIMSDADNTGGTAHAYYDSLIFSAQ